MYVVYGNDKGVIVIVTYIHYIFILQITTYEYQLITSVVVPICAIIDPVG